MPPLPTKELESLVQEAEEATGVGYDAAWGGAAAPGRPAQEHPHAKRSKCAFEEDVDMPQAAKESYEKWTQWRDHVAAAFRAFLADDTATKEAGDHNVELMHCRLDQAGVDVATAWGASSAEPDEALPMVDL